MISSINNSLWLEVAKGSGFRVMPTRPVQRKSIVDEVIPSENSFQKTTKTNFETNPTHQAFSVAPFVDSQSIFSIHEFLSSEEENEENSNDINNQKKGMLSGDKTSENTSEKSQEGELSEEEEKQVRELEKTDQKVRQHEQSHVSAGGPYASAPTYETTTGPDGREYAVAGEVKIDSSPVKGNPQSTIAKMEIVKRAALAPPEPSAQDRKVAMQAEQVKMQAQKEMQEEQEQEQKVTEEKQDQNSMVSYDSEGKTLTENDSSSFLINTAVAAYSMLNKQNNNLENSKISYINDKTSKFDFAA